MVVVHSGLMLLGLFLTAKVSGDDSDVALVAMRWLRGLNGGALLLVSW